MTSNGPWSSVKSLSSRSRTMTALRRSRRSPSQHVDLAEALLAEVPRSSGAAGRAAAARRASPKSRSGREALRSKANPLGHVEHDGDRQHVVRAGQLDQLRARVGLDVGGVDDGQPAGVEPLAGDEVEHLERGGARRLVVLVVGDQAAADVARDDLVRAEVLARERRLARATDADQARRATAPGCRARSCGPSGRRPAGWPARARSLRARPAGTARCTRTRQRLAVAHDGELRPGPLEPVVAVPHRAGSEERVAHVVLGVRRRHDDRRRPGVAEHRALERRQPGRVDVLDRPPSARSRRGRPAARRGRSPTTGAARAGPAACPASGRARAAWPRSRAPGATRRRRRPR